MLQHMSSAAISRLRASACAAEQQAADGERVAVPEMCACLAPTLQGVACGAGGAGNGEKRRAEVREVLFHVAGDDN